MRQRKSAAHRVIKFYVAGIGFVRAEELQSGDILVTSDGKHVTVEAVEADGSVTAETPAMVYNFEVEDWHTYFVGGECVLVHNACADGTAKTPAQRAEEKRYPGIKTTQNGGPDFSGTDYIYKMPDGSEASVTIKMTGDRKKDFNLANEKAGFTDFDWGEPAVDGYTWHHLDDYNAEQGTCTMQLITRDAHKSTFPHQGACAQWDSVNGKTYNKK